MLYTFSILLTLIFWPLGLYLANTRPDFIEYFLPALLLAISFLLERKNSKFYALPLLFIPIIEPKLAIFPLIFMVLDRLTNKATKSGYLYIAIGFLLFIFNFKPFWEQTVFVQDYEARQKVIRDTQLYPSVLLARTFHNKARIVSDKVIYNFFALTDPNNYFFGFHPRQIFGNQNLIKFPFLGVFFFFVALINVNILPNRKLIFVSILSAIFVLSFLTNFDRNDFVFWFPMSMLVIEGLKRIKKYKFCALIYSVYLVFSLVELLRIFITYK